jgi:hypothetical protein
VGWMEWGGEGKVGVGGGGKDFDVVNEAEAGDFVKPHVAGRTFSDTVLIDI